MPNSKIKSFRDLRVWQAAMDAAELVLEACDEEPIARKVRLAGQIEAASASVPANIAEGHAGGSTKTYLKHLYIARGSLAETLTFLELFARRKYISRPRVKAVWNSLQDTGKLLNALITAIARKSTKGRKASRPVPPSPRP